MITLSTDICSTINIAVIALIVISLILGYINGFLMQLIRVILYALIIFVAFMLAPGLADLVYIYPQEYAPFANTSLASVFYSKINTICWFLIIVAIGAVLVLIISPLFKAVRDLPVIKAIDHIVGMLISLVVSFMIIVVATYILSTALFTNGKDIIDNSFLKYTSKVTDQLTSVVSDTFDENTALQKLIRDPLSITTEDVSGIIGWLQNANVSSEDIYNFLLEYGIDVNTLNELLNKGN